MHLTADAEIEDITRDDIEEGLGNLNRYIAGPRQWHHGRQPLRRTNRSDTLLHQPAVRPRHYLQREPSTVSCL